MIQRLRTSFGVAALGGVGFTVSLFIANLAFTDQAVLDTAKIGVLAGSVIAGSVGIALLLRPGSLKRAARYEG